MNTLTKPEIEAIAGKVAAILRDRVDGDPADPETWYNAGRGLCAMRQFDEPTDGGLCAPFRFDDFGARACVVVWGSQHRRPLQMARTLIHELAHAVCMTYAPEVFTETPWALVDYAYQAHENIARAVERYFLGSLGRGWLPTHGFYWH